MLLRIASDFHLEFGTYKSHTNSRYDYNDYKFLPKDDRDSESVLILAGDMTCACKIDQMELFFASISNRFKEIIYVLGNHEHYKGDIKTSYKIIKKFLSKFNNIHVLENESLIIDDIAFYGCTLWTDFNKGNPISMNFARHSMSDFAGLIQNRPKIGGQPGFVRFSPEYSVTEHYASVINYEKFCLNNSDIKKVLVTHHGLSMKSNAPEFQGSQLSPAFLSDREDLLERTKPILHIHGHVHTCHDYMVGSTRVLVNPYGYMDENPSYNPKLFVTV